MVKIPSVPDRSRHELWLEHDDHVRFRAVALARGHQRTVLWFRWFANAVVDAKRGRPVPPAPSKANVPGRRWYKIGWLQSDREFEEWRATLEARGSSPSAVLRAGVVAYLAADGDVIAMDLGT